MLWFDYVAKDPSNGKKIRGIATGDDRDAVAESLKIRGITIISLSPMNDFLGIRKFLHSMSVDFQIKTANIITQKPTERVPKMMILSNYAGVVSA